MSLQQQIELLKQQLDDMRQFIMYDLPVVLHNSPKRRKKRTA